MTSAGEPTCPLCGVEGRPAFVKDGYPHFRCAGCRSLFVSPVPTPDELAAWYRQAGTEKSSALCWEGTGLHAVASWRRALRHARRVAGDGPLLDVGCGAGQFLAFARDEGWTDLVGLEPSPAAAERARDASGASIHEVELRAAPLPEGSCAVVTLWDVIEHVPDPRRVLERVAALVRPGGVVVMGTPNVEGLTTRRFGARALVVMPPEHLFVAARRGLLALVASAGLEPVRTDAVDLRIRDWLGSPPDGATSSGSAGARARYRGLYDRLTGATLFDVAQRAANLFLNTTGLGDQLVMLARKSPRPGGPAR